MEPIAIDTLLTVLNIMLASPGSNIQLNSKEINISSLARIEDNNVRKTCGIQEITDMSDINKVLDFPKKANTKLQGIKRNIQAINTHLSTFPCSHQITGEVGVKLPHLPVPFFVRCERNQYGDNWLLIARRSANTARFRSAIGAELENNGIGDFKGEYFIGFEKLRAITDSQMCELLIVENDGRQNHWYDHYQTVAFHANNKVKQLGKHTSNRGDNSIGLSAHAKAVNKKLKLYLDPNTNIQIYLRNTTLYEHPIFKAA